MLILHVKQLLLGECLARVRPSALLGEDHVGNVQLITGLTRGSRGEEEGKGRGSREGKWEEREGKGRKGES